MFLHHSSGYPPSFQWQSSLIPVTILPHSSDGSPSFQWLSFITPCVITPVMNQASLNFELCNAIWFRLLIPEMANSWTWSSLKLAVFGCHNLLRRCTYYVIIIIIIIILGICICYFGQDLLSPLIQYESVGYVALKLLCWTLNNWLTYIVACFLLYGFCAWEWSLILKREILVLGMLNFV